MRSQKLALLIALIIQVLRYTYAYSQHRPVFALPAMNLNLTCGECPAGMDMVALRNNKCGICAPRKSFGTVCHVDFNGDVACDDWKDNGQGSSTSLATSRHAHPTPTTSHPQPTTQHFVPDKLNQRFDRKSKRIFLNIPTGFRCLHQKEPLVERYVRSLCHEVELGRKIEDLDTYDKAYVSLNEASFFPTLCRTLKWRRDVCYKTGAGGPGDDARWAAKSGAKSKMFQSISERRVCSQSLLLTGESDKERLARCMCRSVAIYEELRVATPIHELDTSYALLSSAYKYPSVCRAIFWRRKHCAVMKKIPIQE